MKEAGKPLKHNGTCAMRVAFAISGLMLACVLLQYVIDGIALATQPVRTIVAATSSQPVPEIFEAEIMSLVHKDAVRVGANGAVVSFQQHASACDLFSDIQESMCGSGWVLQESGLDECGAFFKSAGSLNWAFVNCTEVGDDSVAVFAVPQIQA